jgi:hypothetical protein
MAYVVSMRPVTLPPPPFRGTLLRRAAGLWLLLRAGIVAVGLLLNLAPLDQLVFLTAAAAGFVVLLAAWLTMFDARRRGETLWLANLGVGPGVLLLMVLVPPIAAELGMRLAGAL